jgi:nucleoside-diphosphate-sugar epimerase
LRFIKDLPVEWAWGDLAEPDSIRGACREVDTVCHCAAVTRAVDEETFMVINAQAVEALARTCIEENPELRRFLFLSSAAAVGPSRGPDDYVDETTIPAPITWYGKSKLAAERALLAMSDRLPITIVRPCPVFGPRDRDFLTYFRLVKYGLAVKLGRCERRICLIYVEDLVDLVFRALVSSKAEGQTYVACNRAHSYQQFSDAIALVLGKRTVNLTIPECVLPVISTLGRLQARITGNAPLLNEQRILEMRERYWLCSSAKARSELGFAPRFDLEQGVRRTADWYLAQGML